MSSSESENSEGEETWVPIRQREEWNDVKPAPQNDGLNKVVPIAYTKHFKEVMGYFRAILAKDERSNRALELTEEAIKLNPGNYTRYFVIKNSPHLGGFKAMRDAEVRFCIEAIHAAPSNESPWRYLRGLYKDDIGALIDSRVVEQVCLKELSIDKKCVFASDFLLDNICLGYKPSAELFSLFDFDKQSCNLTKFAGFICSHLQEVDAIRTCYWKWRQETLPPLSS